MKPSQLLLFLISVEKLNWKNASETKAADKGGYCCALLGVKCLWFRTQNNTEHRAALK